MYIYSDLEDRAYQQHEKIKLTDQDDRKKSQSTILIEIGGQFELFHCPQNDAYISVSEHSTTKILPLRSRDFRELLGHKFFELVGKGANVTAISDALNTLEAIAKHKGDEHHVFLRLANLGDKIYLDLGCEKWRVVEVTKDGWSILDNSPVKFYRKRGMMALPVPMTGGNINQLQPFVNVEESDFTLIVSWLMATLGGIKPYPILILQGEQGTGKSTTSRILRALTDPSTVPLRSPPKDIKDLLVSASNNYVVMLDNLSGLSNDISDCLCRLSTGGGIDSRSLFTDNEQCLIDIQRPIIVNGIDDVAARPDLSERSISLELPVISNNRRNDEKHFYLDFDKVKSQIFGALLSGISGALANIENTQLLEKPRMADFAKWVTAAEIGLGWNHGDFMRAYLNNQQHSIEAGIESSPVGSAIIQLMENLSEWSGTSTQLYNKLSDISSVHQVKSKAWPAAPRGLSNTIKRLMPSFRRVGIFITQQQSHDRPYKIDKVGFLMPLMPLMPKYMNSNEILCADGAEGVHNGAEGVHNGAEGVHNGAEGKPLQPTDGGASGRRGRRGTSSATYPNESKVWGSI